MSAYSIWVMEYAYVMKQPTSLFIYGAHNQGYRKMPYGYIVIKGQGRTMMVDVGYNHEAYGKVLAAVVRRRELASAGDRAGRNRGAARRSLDRVPDPRAFRSHGEHRRVSQRDVLHPGARAVEVGVVDVARAPLSLADAGDRSGRHHAPGRSGAAGPAGCVDGDRENVVPGIDLHAAFDTHTWGSMYVTVRNDLSRELRRCLGVRRRSGLLRTKTCAARDPADPQYVPVGLATGSQFKLIMTSEEMVKRAGGDPNRVIPVHEEGAEGSVPVAHRRRPACGSPSWRWRTARPAGCGDVEPPRTGHEGDGGGWRQTWSETGSEHDRKRSGGSVIT